MWKANCHLNTSQNSQKHQSEHQVRQLTVETINWPMNEPTQRFFLKPNLHKLGNIPDI